MTLALRQYQTPWLEFDLNWVAIPKNGTYRAHKIKFSDNGVPYIHGRFGDIEGTNFQEYLRNMGDYLAL